MELKFTETTRTSSGKETMKVLWTWKDLTPKQAKLISYSFVKGFIEGYTHKGDLRYPIDMTKDGCTCQSWNWHKDNCSGTFWAMRNGKNQIVKF